MAEENKCPEVEENERNKRKVIFDGVGFWVFGNEEGEVVNRRGEVMETTGKKRKRRRKEKEEEKAEEEGFERRDPLDVFGSDVMMMIMHCLDARSVALSLLVSRRWHGVASSDRLWTIKRPVDSANEHGILLEVVQVLTDLNLTITKAYISSDGVFNVTDQDGNKIADVEVLDYIQKTLGLDSSFAYSMRRSVGVKSAMDHTVIELIGSDRPGLLSEMSA